MPSTFEQNIEKRIARQLEAIQKAYKGKMTRKTKIYGRIPVAKSIFDFLRLVELFGVVALGNIGWRGMANKDWRFDSGLARLVQRAFDVSGSETHSLTYFANYTESRMIKRVRTNRLGSASSPTLSDLEILSMLQHFGGATRLLDLSKNALVALYFACRQLPTRDGVVVSVGFHPSLVKRLDMYEECQEPILRILEANVNKLVVWEPSPLFQRMHIQQSIFLVTHLTKGGWGTVSEHPFDLVLNSIRPFNAILVPASSKAGMLKAIEEMFGYGESHFFPDLEGIAKSYAVDSATAPYPPIGETSKFGEDGALQIELLDLRQEVEHMEAELALRRAEIETLKALRTGPLKD